ncbi:MAG TPA: hypothetical protein VFD21_08920 [Vicinamibacterales bacterium]|jgi:hypothetical protein|nr:hypothetical protein [Vicinamibacterales bacterium]
MRTALIAGVCALVLPIAACSIDVYPGPLNHTVDLPAYPAARPVNAERPSDPDVTFSGNFGETNVVPRAFESDDTPEMILDFYRRVLRARGAVVECRGTINIYRRRGNETVACLDRPSSRAVRLVAGVEGAHSVVVVTTRGSTTQFAVLGIHTGD